jgi:hypothetical protein
MPEDNQPVTETPAWVSQLPDDLKQNPSLTSFKTIGELAKAHLDTSGKMTELTGKLEHSIPKLPDNATDEDRSLYYEALGRPKDASEYEFEGEDKSSPEWTGYWKQQFHGLGLSKQQAKVLSGAFNGQMQKMVEAHNAQFKAEQTAAEQKLRTEMGDKFDTNVELAKRMTQKHLGTEFDKTFANLTGEAKFGVVRLLLKTAELTGEDRSPQGGFSQAKQSQTSFISYDKSPAPPKR